MPDKPPAPIPPWKLFLDVEGQDAGHYQDYANLPLLDVIEGVPKRVLELGCSSGTFGMKLMERFPGAHVVGVEPGRAAAHVAAGRLERVIAKRLENVDFAADGFTAGEFDTVIAADVLEHVVNPWDVLVRVKPLIAPGGQLVASIPNVRNLWLLSEALLKGRWTYEERGLLDVTHIRFFTLEEIRRMLEQTGYRMEGFAGTISPRLADVWRQNSSQEKVTLELGRMSLKDVTRQELMELCCEQFLVRARPVAEAARP